MCNFVTEGTASGIDKIDFNKLDETKVKMRGLYGDRQKLGEYLVEKGVLKPEL